MRVNTERLAGVVAPIMATLMPAVFRVSAGFGELPLLPYLIEQLPGAGV